MCYYLCLLLACQCFNHAIECVYDEEVERKKISVTPEGIYEGGGRCLDCQVKQFCFHYKLYLIFIYKDFYFLYHLLFSTTPVESTAKNVSMNSIDQRI